MGQPLNENDLREILSLPPNEEENIDYSFCLEMLIQSGAHLKNVLLTGIVTYALSYALPPLKSLPLGITFFGYLTHRDQLQNAFTDVEDMEDEAQNQNGNPIDHSKCRGL